MDTMPFGTLRVEDNAVPTFAPPYTNDMHKFTDVDLVAISYRITAASVKHLVPDVLELEEEPRMTSIFLDYGMSAVGSYKEFVHLVEVTYRGQKYDYSIVLVLDNEAAIFCGRETFGYPKVFGRTVIQRETGGRSVLGHVERPAGNRAASFEFIPERLSETGLPTAFNPGLNLRVIPSKHARGSTAAIKELVPALMEFTYARNVWLGTGHVSFPKSSAINPWANVDIVRYEGAFYANGASAVLRNPTETFPL